MRQRRVGVLLFIAAFLVAGVTVVSVGYIRAHSGQLLPPPASRSGPNLVEARLSTQRVRGDLEAIRELVKAGEWVTAEGRLRAVGKDWTALERSTRLTNRHFADGILLLHESLRLHRRRDSMELIGRMDNLLQLLDGVLGPPSSK